MVSLMLAVSAIALFGMLALATEAGTWYLQRARAQDTADAAAWAATLTGSSSAATDIAAQNGFNSGITVNNPPATCLLSGSKCSTSDTTQYEVIINVGVTRYLSTLFTSAAPTIEARSVGALESVCPSSGVACVCMLSLSGDLAISQTQTSSRCLYASNATDTSGISIGATTAVTAYSLSTRGDCSTSGCAGIDVALTRPYSSYQPAVTNPYSGIDTAAPGWTLPACGNILPPSLGAAAFTASAASTAKTITVASGGTNVPLNEILLDTTNPGKIPAGTYATAHTATSITVNNTVTVAKSDSIEPVKTVALTPGLYSTAATCAADSPYLVTTTSPPTFIMTASGTTWTLAAGIYYFSGVSLNIANGTIECLNGVVACTAGGSGLTILLATGGSGATIGNLFVCTMSGATCGSATAATFTSSSINAQPTVSGNTALNGILFYRDSRGAAGTASSPSAWIWGNANTVMNGVMYFPGAFVSYGNPGSASTCAAVIAGTLSLTKTTTSTADTFCGNYGVTLPQAVAARMVE